MPTLEEELQFKNGSSGDIAIRIDEILRDLPSTGGRPSIYRVSDQLRRLSPEMYSPELVGIGPFHHGEPKLQKMEHHKYLCLKALLARRKESSVHRYVSALKILEERARSCYAEHIELDSDEFVKMLLLDGIFVIEFLRKYDEKHSGIPTGIDDDEIFRFEYIQCHLLQDLMLYENQLPFFVIERLFNLSQTQSSKKMRNLIWPLMSDQTNSIKDLQVNPHHLLGLVHWEQSSRFRRDFTEVEKMENMKSATELKECGVVFKIAKNPSCLFDIKFSSEKLSIPLLQINDSTESWLKNMIAYEYYLPENEMKFFSDYAFFLHCLIHSEKDAGLLRHRGIISNWLGGDEMVYHMINQLGKNVQISRRFSFYDVFEKVNKHCLRERNRYMVILRRDYFDTPWKVISLVGVFLIFLLSATQTTFAILSYRNDITKGNP